MVHSVSVVAPTRLHFGLYGFGPALERQFGGMGAMVEPPVLRLRATKAERFEASGPLADRASQFAQRWATFHGREAPPPCRVEVLAAPPEHSGLGVGTQLGLSVAAALHALCEMSPVTATELAMSVSRGLRSAVGTYGFAQGGLIAERGKLRGEAISPLDMRVELPAAWRFVLVRPDVNSGLAGQAEVQAFEQLPPVPAETTQRLIRLAREELIPAALQADFAAFSGALYRYCHEAGLCFAAVQGGPYNGPVLTRLVAAMRTCGAEGVGQSSWGPTLFALLPSEAAAKEFEARLGASINDIRFSVHIAAANNRGAQITVS
jgi:beta-RFAP synthase